MKTLKTNILALPRLSASLFLNFSAFLAIFPVLTLFLSLSACSNGAPTVIPATVKTTNPASESGTLVPRIQFVSPGTLQSLSSPNAVATGVSCSNPGIVIVFSHVMENDGGEMSFSVQLLNGTANVPCTMYPPTSSSASFAVKPVSALSADTVYTLRIYRTCYINDRPTRVLEFTNLDSTSNPLTTTDYVDYSFRTSASAVIETTSPVVTDVRDLSGTSITSGSAVVDPNPSTGTDYYFQLILSDNATPMIDPTTVTNTTVTLYDVDTATYIDGSVVCDADSDLRNYKFYPSSALGYGANYRMTVSDGTGIKDMSGNTMISTSYAFTTSSRNSSTAPSIQSYSVTGVGSTTATVIWTTDYISIAHAEIKSGRTAPTSAADADQTAHNSSLGVWFSATFSGLSPNTEYSMRLCASNDTTKTSTDAFSGAYDDAQSYSVAFKTLPDTTDGATGNYMLSASGTMSSLSAVQINAAESYVTWQNGSSTILQYMNTSVSGSPGSWDKWTSGGETIFSSANPVAVVYDGSDGVIAARTNAGVYANRIRNNGGAIEFVWGNATTGSTIYSGAVSGTAQAAITYSEWVTPVTSGTVSTDFLYSASGPFASVATGYYAISESSLSTLKTDITKVDNYFLTLSGSIVNGANGRSYRISTATAGYTGSPSANTAASTTFTSANMFNIGDLITNSTGTNTAWACITNFSAPYTYTISAPLTLSTSDTLTSFPYVTNGTADSNTLYSSTNLYAASVAANDIAVNTSSNCGWDKVTSVYGSSGSSRNLLTLNDSTKYIFNNAGESFSILRLNNASTFVCGGYASSISGNDVTHASADFTALGVQTGDIVYNISAGTYAKITAVGTTTLTLSSQIFSGSESFIVFRRTLVSFFWSDGSNISMRSVSLADGSTLYTSLSFTLGTNPFPVSDLTGNAIVVYENGGSLYAEKLRASTTVVWGPTSLGVTGYIKKAEADGAGGVWVLYTSDSSHNSTCGILHINTAGAVTFSSGIIANTSYTDMAVLSTSTAGIVYETPVTVGSNSCKRVRLGVYNFTGAVGTYNVQSADYASSQLNPHIGKDSLGGAHISWLDTHFAPSAPYSLFTQHISSGYSRVYADYVSLTMPTTAADIDDPFTLTQTPLYYTNGGTSGAGFYLWLDGRTSTNREVYFQPAGN
jgi:hypothetical protein